MITTQCTHHWLIETADGRVSRGGCRFGREERDFDNFPEDVNHYTVLAHQKRPEKRRSLDHLAGRDTGRWQP